MPPRLVDATSVFNPGAIEHSGGVILALRVQARSRETFLMIARSDDGCHDAGPDAGPDSGPDAGP